ncbi:MAG: hypothetical protein JW941_03960 [Candidatus Coatesbacteria bacterium]|nr:hypothetical protein [Candidatus Coatesbacteria bacterium]
MDSSLISIIRPIARLLAFSRKGIKELGLVVLYFGVIGPLTIFVRRRDDPFRSGRSTWREVHEGGSDIGHHSSKL